MSLGRFRLDACCCSQDLFLHKGINYYASLNPGFRSPSVTTMRDIDPKLPAARPNLDGYPLSDGDWPADDRYILS